MWLLQNEKQAFLRRVAQKNQKNRLIIKIYRIGKLTGLKENYLSDELSQAIDQPTCIGVNE